MDQVKKIITIGQKYQNSKTWLKDVNDKLAELHNKYIIHQVIDLSTEGFNKWWSAVLLVSEKEVK